MFLNMNICILVVLGSIAVHGHSLLDYLSPGLRKKIGEIVRGYEEDNPAQSADGFWSRVQNQLDGDELLELSAAYLNFRDDEDEPEDDLDGEVTTEENQTDDRKDRREVEEEYFVDNEEWIDNEKAKQAQERQEMWKRLKDEL